MKVLFLGPSCQLIESFLIRNSERFKRDEVNINKKDLTILGDFDFLISYRYKYILSDLVLSQFQQRAVNIHISLLPWNKGADPNLWSFLENTPKGVTIHQMNSALDAGDIFLQREVEFSSRETLRSSYEKLSAIATKMFLQNCFAIYHQNLAPRKQVGTGSFHYARDKEPYMHLLTEGWDTPVENLIGQALNC